MAGETGDGHSRNLAGGWTPRHAESYALAGALGGNHATVWSGQNARKLRVGQAGDVSIVDESGATVVIPAVVAGETIELAFSQINAATTAQKLTAFWA